MIEVASSPDLAMQSRADNSQLLRGRLSPESVVRRQEPLAKKTTLRVGGPADLYVEPGSIEDLSAVLQFCRENNQLFFVLGRGSNLLVRDNGFRGVAISLSNPRFSRIDVAGDHLSCGAGARLKAVVMEARRQSLTGLEFLEGIPGSVGGALRMNAGAMGGEIFQVVESVRLMDFNGRIMEKTPTDLEVHYRSCPTLKDHIALGAVLRATPSDRQTVDQRLNEFSRKRWRSQPAAPSAGCIFKNPKTIPAGKLVDELGLKGLRVGGAFVSAEHGNFIVNDGTATAQNVLDLIELIRERARTHRGIQLETEVEIIGD